MTREERDELYSFLDDAWRSLFSVQQAILTDDDPNDRSTFDEAYKKYKEMLPEVTKRLEDYANER